MTPGRIILLNGTSSSGKTTVARELLGVLPSPYYHLPVDVFNAARGQDRTRELDGARLDEALRTMRAGYHRAIAGMAHAGNDVLADYVLSEPWRLADCLDVCEGLDVMFVGIHCPRNELRRRERARGDREIGQAERQYENVHAHGTYDVELDTSTSTPRECAEKIARVSTDPPRPSAFDLLRRPSLLRRRS